ncbi:FtsK/SpoIIIE domain-containing protein [Arthrobacter sp. NPDC080082]|uniref:FtsK/SpoIIIE domain-containing protein n=1 Tax=unclassified Arthrobacter TaxID=235627 RepID=UPI0034217B88
MILQCTLAGGPRSAILSPVELTVELPDGCAGSRLEEALRRKFATSLLRVAGVPLSDLSAGTPPLVNGAVFVDGLMPSAENSLPASAEPTLTLAVLGGPLAGTLLPLRRGSYRLGRSGVDLVIPDPGLSREHARLEITPASATLEDLGSANGTWVDGRRISKVPLITGAEIRCGNSVLGLFGGTPGDQPVVNDEAGADTSAPLPLPAPPSTGHIPTLLITSLLPLLAGIILTLVTGTWMFLAFTAFSALPVLVSVFGGRRRRRQWRSEVAAAALADADRRRRAAPSVAALVTASAAARHGVPWEPAGDSIHVAGGLPDRAAAVTPVWLRLGVAEQPANVRPTWDTGSFRPPDNGRLPVTLDPGIETVLSGPTQAIEGLLRSFVIQLASYPRAALTSVYLIGPPGKLLLSARFLPRIFATAAEGDAVAALRRTLSSAAGPPGVVICLPGYPASEALRVETQRLGWQLISWCQDGPTGARTGQAVSLRATGGRLTTASGLTEFVPDLVPDTVFDSFCRRRGGQPGVPPASGGIPARWELQETLTLTRDSVKARWAATSLPTPPRMRLSVPVGRGATGAVFIDLQRDGPHLLVAGTTGSGKSEFLRTLVLALSASHSPSEVTFLLIDFKGGSGLGPLAELPHCVGVLTDLDGHEIDRALVSLRAEVRRREQLLARADVPDLASYRLGGDRPTTLPRLILVVDEFRVLVDEAPAALSELMRLAAIGRSLGIHLVMATQRPQGALNADIRANVTSSVVLRVQSEAESLDVMNAKLAAAIPTDSPGRAYLIRGNAAPEEFQTATLAGTERDSGAGHVTVMTAEEFLTNPPLPAARGSEALIDSADAAASFIELARTLWLDDGGELPHRPIAPPLPTNVPFPGPASPIRSSGDPGPVRRPGFRLGIVDLPEHQSQSTVGWSPPDDGHLALLGGPTHGRGTLSAGLKLLLAQWAADAIMPAYILDADGTLASAASHPLAGAVVGPGESRRAARLLARLSEEMARRLAASSAPTAALLLVVHGWGTWVSAFRSGPYAWAEDLFQDLIRGGPGAGITVIVTGDRELVTARFFASLPNRIYFPATATLESRLMWPAVPKVRAIAGRVIASGPFAAGCRPDAGRSSPVVPPSKDRDDGVGMGQTRYPGSTGSEYDDGPDNEASDADTFRVAQLFEPPPWAGPAMTGDLVGTEARLALSFRVEALPDRVTVRDVASRLLASAADGGRAGRKGRDDGRFWIGLAGDEPGPSGIELPASGVAAVLGAPGTGKSTLLESLVALNPLMSWLKPDKETPQEYWTEIHRRADAGTLDRNAVALADDLDLSTSEVNNALRDLNGRGWRVIFTAGYGPLVQQRVPLAMQARLYGKGVLLRPRSLMDGDLFGVRFDPESHQPAGRAVLIGDGTATWVQLAVPEPSALSRKDAKGNAPEVTPEERQG